MGLPLSWYSREQQSNSVVWQVIQHQLSAAQGSFLGPTAGSHLSNQLASSNQAALLLAAVTALLCTVHLPHQSLQLGKFLPVTLHQVSKTVQDATTFLQGHNM